MRERPPGDILWPGHGATPSQTAGTAHRLWSLAGQESLFVTWKLWVIFVGLLVFPKQSLHHFYKQLLESIALPETSR